MNTCYPARIVSFEAETQTAVVQLVIERYHSNLETRYKAEPTEHLVDVPCHFPKGGGHSITMPVSQGDDCLVFFAQRGINHWLYQGKEVTGGLEGRPSPQHLRKFSKTDAIALIGFGSGILEDTPKTIKDFDTGAIEIRNSDRTQRISLHVESKAIEVLTSDSVTVKAPNIILDGDVKFTGKMVDKNGIDHVVHTHGKGTYIDSKSRPLSSSFSGVPA